MTQRCISRVHNSWESLRPDLFRRASNHGVLKLKIEVKIITSPLRTPHGVLEGYSNVPLQESVPCSY